MKLKLVLIMLLSGMFALQAQDEVMMLVGTYTDAGSRGVYCCQFNQETGAVAFLDSLEMRNPSYLTVSSQERLAYVVSETSDDEASLNVVRIDVNGGLRLLDSQRTEGADPCYVSTNGEIILTANYSGGSMSVFRLSQCGTLIQLAKRFFGATGGPDAKRQNLPHVHCACFAPDGRYVLATDFSADRILSFRIDGNDVMDNGVAAEVLADSGPRHLTFGNDGRFAYLMSELSGKVTVFCYKDGRLEKLQEIVSDSVGARGGADIHLSPDGQFLYSSNRLKDDGIAIFAVDMQTGLLTRVGYQPTAIHPRHFNITPNGRFLLCCCRDSGKIQVFSRDDRTGLLTDTHQDILLSKPVCVQFF